MGEEKEKALNQSMSKSNSLHKISNIDFLPTKQEYEFVKEDWANEISQLFFSGNETRKDHKIF